MAIDLDETKIEHNKFQLWLGWTLATTAGMLFGFLLSIPLVNLLDLALARVVIPIVTGFLIGFSQWIILRRYLVSGTDWILAGGTAWAVGYTLGLLIIQNFSDTILGGVIAYILFGAVVALAQWQMLRREVPHLLIWILVSSLAWTVGLLAGQGVLTLLFSAPSVIEPALSTAIIAVTNGLVAGAITGAALIWIARQPEVF